MHCLRCHYPLAGLAVGRCPECGREFDPPDPTTFGSAQRRAFISGKELGRNLVVVGPFGIVIVAEGHGVAPVGLVYGAALLNN